MIDCTELSDRMPEVARGQGRWTADEERHLSGCPDCRAEWEIVSAAFRLGAGAPIPRDTALTSNRVLERLAANRARNARIRRVGTAAGLAAAAAIALAVWTGQRPGPGRPTDGVPVLATPSTGEAAPSTTASTGGLTELPVPELDSLPAEALDSMLRALDEPLARADAYDTPDFGDAGDHELEQALSGLEG